MKLFLSAFFLICSSVIARAQPIVDVQVSRTNILIGETIEIRLQVDPGQRSSSARWMLPDSLPHFEYLKIDTTPAVCLIRLTGWDSGYWQLPPLYLETYSGEKRNRSAISLPKIKVGWGRFSDPRPSGIRPIIEAPAQHYDWKFYVFSVFVLSAVAGVFFLWRRKTRKKISVITDKTTPLTTKEIRILLEEMDPSGWTTYEIQKREYTHMRELLQTYLDQFTEEPGRSRTLSETILSLRHRLPEEMFKMTRRIVRETDLVIYAGHTASESERQAAKEMFLTLTDHLTDQS